MSRARLRSRVFAVTALNAAMLIAIALVLTTRARSTQQQFRTLLVLEGDSAVAAEHYVRRHAALDAALVQLARSGNRDRSMDLVSRYESVAALLERVRIRDEHYARLLRADRMFRRDAPALAASGAADQLEARADELASLATEFLNMRRRAINEGTLRLDRDARDTIWTAVAIAYIIAVISFAVVRQALAKVVTPLEELSRAAEQIAAGDLSARSPVRGDREVAMLAASFNRMAANLAENDAELRQRARTDELTKLPNFRAFREAIDEEILRASRYEQTFGVLVFDLDRFKKYNDKFGHLAGNEALRQVADAIRANVRVVDFPARYGGEEFAAVLPQIDDDGLHSLAERIRNAVEALPPPPGRPKLTVSIGGALYPYDGTTADRLFLAADERLYEAKRTGRNRTVVAETAAGRAGRVGSRTE